MVLKYFRMYMMVNLKEFSEYLKANATAYDTEDGMIVDGQMTIKNMITNYLNRRKQKTIPVSKLRNGEGSHDYIISFYDEIPRYFYYNNSTVSISNEIYLEGEEARAIKIVKKIENYSEVADFIKMNSAEKGIFFIFNEEFDLYLILNKNHKFYNSLSDINFIKTINAGTHNSKEFNEYQIIDEKLSMDDFELDLSIYGNILDCTVPSYYYKKNVLEESKYIWMELASLLSNVDNEEYVIDCACELFKLSKAHEADWQANGRKCTGSFISKVLPNYTNDDKIDLIKTVSKRIFSSKVLNANDLTFEIIVKDAGVRDFYGKPQERKISDESLVKFYDLLVSDKKYSSTLVYLLMNNPDVKFDINKINLQKFLKVGSLVQYNSLFQKKLDPRVSHICNSFTKLGSHSEYIYPSVLLITACLNNNELEINKNTIASAIISKISANGCYNISEPLKNVINEEQEKNLKVICDEIALQIEKLPALSARSKIRIIYSNGNENYKAKQGRTIFHLLQDSLRNLNSKKLNKILVDEAI